MDASGEKDGKTTADETRSEASDEVEETQSESSETVERTQAQSSEDADETEPTPQSAALRRQQRYVGIGGAVLAGLALATGTFQQFPDAPAGAALAGLVGTALVLWVVRKSIFPGDAAAAENTGEGGA